MLLLMLFTAALLILMIAVLASAIDSSMKRAAEERVREAQRERQWRLHEAKLRQDAWRMAHEAILRQHIAAARARQVPTWAKILGVSASADVNEIKAAFHKKAKQYHPDLGGSTAAMSALNRAFEEAIAYKKASG